MPSREKAVLSPRISRSLCQRKPFSLIEKAVLSPKGIFPDSASHVFSALRRESRLSNSAPRLFSASRRESRSSNSAPRMFSASRREFRSSNSAPRLFSASRRESRLSNSAPRIYSARQSNKFAKILCSFIFCSYLCTRIREKDSRKML